MENDYFYIDGSGKQQGPVSAQTLQSCGVTANTLVWHAGMTDWKPAGQVEELSGLFQQTTGATPPPHPSFTNSFAGYQANTQMPPCPDDHMTAAIIVTVIWFFFGFNIIGLIPGIVAIIKADKVTNFYRMGQYDEALLASTDASKWVKYSVIGGILAIVLSIVLVIAFFAIAGVSLASMAATL